MLFCDYAPGWASGAQELPLASGARTSPACWRPVCSGGKAARYSADYEALCQHLSREFPIVYLDSFLAWGSIPGAASGDAELPLPSSCPPSAPVWRPRRSDLTHYQNSGLAAIVLCSTQGQAKLLGDMLRDTRRGVRAGL